MRFTHTILTVTLLAGGAHAANTTLAPEDASFLNGAETFEAPGHVPNYLRAMSLTPNLAKPLGHLFTTVVTQGALDPEIKLEMGLHIARAHGNAYLTAHLERLLKTTDRGRALLRDTASESDRLALRYADALTKEVHGLDEVEFRQAKGYFNDSQIVELSLTTCFFNYFSRLTTGLNLPLEPWASNSEPKVVSHAVTPTARVALISDSEADAIVRTKQAPKNAALNIGFANSMRAMYLSPDLAQAWRDMGTASQAYDTVGREIKLHISFAVSMANQCRYCTLHQVLGLQRLGVDPKKLLAMKKDDSQLTPRELAAVVFARKLTKDPSKLTTEDFAAMKKEFGDQGSVEVLLQTCNFSFMNRFTDGLKLPSEDEAVKVYNEIYGAQAYETYLPKK